VRQKIKIWSVRTRFRPGSCILHCYCSRSSPYGIRKPYF